MDDTKNKGNVLEELEYLLKYYAPFKKWMDTHPENVLYFSHVSQNEMISILSNLLKLSLKNLIGQGFDDAVNMTGKACNDI
jgi:hypothetical protein